MTLGTSALGRPEDRHSFIERYGAPRSTDNLGSHCPRAEAGLNPRLTLPKDASGMIHIENRIAGLLTQIRERVKRYRLQLILSESRSIDLH